MIEVRLEGLARRDRFRDQLNAVWGAGDKVTISGPTGSGKSSLLDIITGFASPTGGWASIQTPVGQVRLTKGPSGIELVRNAGRVSQLGVGRLFQNAQRFHSLSVRSTLHLARRAVDSNTFLDEAIDNLLGAARIPVSEPMGNLSFGQARIVALASAKYLARWVLILDEPAAGLSDGMRRIVTRFLDETSSEDVLVVAAEHQDRVLKPTRSLTLHA